MAVRCDHQKLQDAIPITMAQKKKKADVSLTCIKDNSPVSMKCLLCWPEKKLRLVVQVNLAEQTK